MRGNLFQLHSPNRRFGACFDAVRGQVNEAEHARDAAFYRIRSYLWNLMAMGLRLSRGMTFERSISVNVNYRSQTLRRTTSAIECKSQLLINCYL